MAAIGWVYAADEVADTFVRLYPRLRCCRKGHHGLREAHFMFNEQESLVMIMTVVPEDKVEPILAGLRPLFERHSGVMFVGDVSVSRRDYFGKKTGGS
jgi:hypothetical protein